MIKKNLSKPLSSKPSSSKKKKGKKKSNQTPQKRKQGRPKGSKNQPYQEPDHLSFQSLKRGLIQISGYFRAYLPDLQAPYLVLDGFYGCQDYFKLAQNQGFEIITKLKCNAHLIYPYIGKQKEGRGRKKRLGERVNYDQMPAKYLVKLTENQLLKDKKIQVYQFCGYANAIKGQWLNFVVIQSSTVKNKMGQIILVSSDLTLTVEEIIHYYHLRFQIEFDFRNAKQFFGLSTFQNYKQKQVDMAVNMAFSMTLIAQILLEKYKKILHVENFSINDLKACFRVNYYYHAFLNIPQKDPEQFLFDQKIRQVIANEAINI